MSAGQLEALNFLYEQNDWLEVMPASLIPLISQDGNIYTVPVNIHRSNMLWYNPEVLRKNGMAVPSTLNEWFRSMAVLKASGMDAPLALGEQWTAMHLMETIFLASLGPEKYNQLWSGDLDWASPDVSTALIHFRRALSYTNSDAISLSWQDASQLVISGDAAYNVMGDWAEGFYKELGKTPHDDFGWLPVPGTQGTFQFLSDSFVLAANAAHREEAIAWLTVAGSRAGQDAFNPVKGSIPARSDADRSLYDEYLQSAMDDWARDEIVGSLAHGVVANDSWKNEINNALGIFLQDKNILTFQAALVAACKSSGPCQ